MVQNQIGLRHLLERLRGTTIERDLRSYRQPLEAIGDLESEIRATSDAELAARSHRLIGRARGGEDLVSLTHEAFALARDAASRTLGQRPYDVQVVAALALARGRVVEMQTGEGKTLAAVLPVYLNAVSGLGVHVLTVNDYLAQRDAEWMGPIYRLLGLSVGWVREGMNPSRRRRAYARDVTYVTAKEAGFDFLRDRLATEPSELVHRPFHHALIDEADCLLIDEARVPLVIAGSSERGESSALRLATLVRGLESEIDYDTDEYGRNVELTEVGFDRAERQLGCGNLLDEDNYLLLTELNCALHALVLLRRDVDYIVRGGRLELVDEFTGRVAAGRHWPDGLQAALEAKEGLDRGSDGRMLGSITLQHFLGSYPGLCGMTGTARGAAKELDDFYDLGVTVIPAHRPLIRTDRPDLIFSHRQAKERAVIEEVRRLHETGRPVLVGTLTIEESERLAARLESAGISCQVLNAKNDALEAEIVARAGALGAVTISTNMAGRGTDIRLGGADEADHDAVARLGGLYVIGTNRHESRRVDLQLRGRSGRQGDPGESRFFLSLEDDLLVRYGVKNLIPPRFLPPPGEEPIDNPVVSREIARAQRIIEGQNFEIRKTLWRYAAPVEEQRRLFHRRRQTLLLEESAPDVWSRDGPPDSADRYRELVAAVGEDAVRSAETLITLRQLDRAWSEHLSRVADLREGNHLIGLGGEDPLTRFRVEIAELWNSLFVGVDEDVLAALSGVSPGQGGLDLGGLEIKGPSSTWTYLINDDPFRDQLGMMLTGPGNTSLSIGAALHAPVFFALWLITDWIARRKKRTTLSRPDRGIDRSGRR